MQFVRVTSRKLQCKIIWRKNWLLFSLIINRPKYAIQQLKKKMFSTNPHSAHYALLVLESVVKNCGAPIHDEISNKANCEMFQNLVNSTQHDEVRTKMLELIQAWAFAFRSIFKYRSIRVSKVFRLFLDDICLHDKH